MSFDPLERLKNQVEDEGYQVGSPGYDFRLLELKVQTCQQMQNVELCSMCKAIEACETGMRYEQERRAGRRKPLTVDGLNDL